jgi:asparagine synthase (glutamine-hydrolysing)
MIFQGNRVVLSGIGGDEIMGGVPTPTPELEDLLARGHFSTLAHQLKVWALNKRKPWFYLLFESARGFFPPALVGVPKHMRPAPWLQTNFVKQNRAALQGYPARVTLFGPLPTFQENVSTIEALQRQLGCDWLPSGPPYEKSYPYLDSGLLEFICAVPREQLVRPGQRRSLMRRALVGIVPDELLNRKRKAFVARGPRVGIAAELPHLLEFSQKMDMTSLEIADSVRFVEALQKTRQGAKVSIVALMRTLSIELWLRNLTTRHLLGDSTWRRGTSAKQTHPKTDGVSPIASNVGRLR